MASALLARAKDDGCVRADDLDRGEAVQGGLPGRHYARIYL
jgi:hypothetical protein